MDPDEIAASPTSAPAFPLALHALLLSDDFSIHLLRQYFNGDLSAFLFAPILPAFYERAYPLLPFRVSIADTAPPAVHAVTRPRWIPDFVNDITTVAVPA